MEMVAKDPSVAGQDGGRRRRDKSVVFQTLRFMTSETPDLCSPHLLQQSGRPPNMI